MKTSEILELNAAAKNIASLRVAVSNLESSIALAERNYQEKADAVLLRLGHSPKTHRLNLTNIDDPKVEEIVDDGFHE